MNISGLDKAEVLAALFNASRQQGMGFLDSRGDRDMSKERAAEILKITEDFDYLDGRVMKISLYRDEVETRLYDRDNGQGSAERAIAHLVAARDKTAARVAMITPGPGAATSRARSAARSTTDNSLDLTNPLNPLSPFSPLNTTFDSAPQPSSDHCSGNSSADYGSSNSSSDSLCSYSSDSGSSSSSYD
ncbi:hypothetical protein [Pseudomonas sp. PS02290]|uniref:hypothetical protein n=1 Tax=Pseudomonas sp. PS02290 TaxID=2991430 RepID=UPI00249CB562|nr:hypothetical protein [Pseudomonas sp. PS02290]